MKAAHCVCVSLAATANLSINKMVASRANQHAFFDCAKRACPFCCFSVLWSGPGRPAGKLLSRGTLLCQMVEICGCGVKVVRREVGASLSSALRNVCLWGQRVCLAVNLGL